MSATTGFWLSVLKRFAAVELEVAFAAFLSFFSFFFFLSFATNYPLPNSAPIRDHTLFRHTTVTWFSFSLATWLGS